MSKCPKCGSIRIVETPSVDMSICLACESLLNTIDDKSKPTVFHRITKSPEVLAPKFVYYMVNRDQFGTYYWYCSALIPGEKWSEEAEAIAATLARLKEKVGDDE